MVNRTDDDDLKSKFEVKKRHFSLAKLDRSRETCERQKRGAFPRDPSPHARAPHRTARKANRPSRRERTVHGTRRRGAAGREKKKKKEKRPLLAPPLAASPPSRFPLAPRLIPAESDARLLARPHSGAFRQPLLPLLLGGGHKRGRGAGRAGARNPRSISPLLRVAAEFGRSGLCVRAVAAGVAVRSMRVCGAGEGVECELACE